MSIEADHPYDEEARGFQAPRTGEDSSDSNGSGHVSNERPRLTQEERDSLTVFEISAADDKELMERSGGNGYQVSEALRFKGVQPDSGFVNVRWPDGTLLTVTTEREHFGGLED